MVVKQVIHEVAICDTINSSRMLVGLMKGARPNVDPDPGPGDPLHAAPLPPLHHQGLFDVSDQIISGSGSVNLNQMLTCA